MNDRNRTQLAARRITRRRQGFSLLELLVSIAIISVMTALLLPAVQQARGAARNVSCQNRLRQLSIAILSNADLHGRFPAMGHFSTSQGDGYHSWVTSILPQIEQGPLWEQYDLSQPYDTFDNQTIGQSHVETLICPDDISVQVGEGNLSYVVNGGIAWTIPIDCPAILRSNGGDSATLIPIDLNGDGIVCGLSDRNEDAEIMESLGLFFVENWPLGSGTKRHHRIDDVRDGTSNTVMMAENIRAGFDPLVISGWSSPHPPNNAFFLSGTICKDESCISGNVDYRRANDNSQLPSSLESINSSLNQPEGIAPWPSSLHAGGVNFSFVDGHVKSVSTLISGEVYAAIVSPQGGRLAGPLQQQVIGGSEF